MGDIIRRFHSENRIESISQREKILDTRDKRNIIWKIKKDPILSAPKLAAEIFNKTGKKVHPQTIRRTLKESSYNERVARKKPYVNEANRKKRLKFAKKFF